MKIQQATAKHDPSYKLKKRGLLNAHDMKRIAPSNQKLIYGIDGDTPLDPIRVNSRYESSAEKKFKEAYGEKWVGYATNDIINTSVILSNRKG